jgi:hypothetical protein
MTYPASSSAETHQSAPTAETTIRPDAYSEPAPQDIAAKLRQETDRPEEENQLIDGRNAEPNGTARGKSETNEKAPLAKTAQETSGRLNRLAETSQPQFRRSGHLSQIWRRTRLQVLAALGAGIIGYAFGHVVAENDRAMRLFFSAAVGIGLFFVFSAFATQLSRTRRRRLY